MEQLELIKNISIPDEPVKDHENFSFEDLILLGILFLLLLEKKVDIILVVCIFFLYLDLDVDLDFDFLKFFK